MKKIIPILLALAVLGAVTALAAGGSQKGASSGYRSDPWAKEELAKAEENQLMPEPLGLQDLTKPITRLEYASAAVFLYDKLLALNPGATAAQREAAIPEGGRYPFSDTQDEAVLLAYRRCLIEGVGSGKFDPDGLLTREQAATILQRIITQTGQKLPGLCGTNFVNMTDIDDISSWAREGAALMANLGVIQGKPDGNAAKFDPRGTLTGQEALVMNQRLAEQMEAFAKDAAAQGVNFPAAFFEAVQSGEPNKSLSPVSARYALGLLRAGAGGTNMDQLDSLLTGVDFELWNKALTTKENGPTVEVANSIWFDKTVTPNKDYLDAVKKLFDAESQTLDLTTKTALDTINQWVSDKTHGLIKSILDQPLGDDAAAVLLNALYFKGDWAVPFDAGDTWDQTFHNQNKTEKKVPFMHATRHGMSYIDTDTCRGAALPYKGDGWWMLALMPKGDGTAESLAGENFNALLGNAQDAYVRLALPKFTVEGAYDLTAPLQAMGLTEAFSGGDFTPMGTCTKGPIKLSKVIQKTYLKVDEKGTEAAAVTGAIMEAGAALDPEKPVELTFDRPFLCCLWNAEISQPLFLTAVNELG